MRDLVQFEAQHRNVYGCFGGLVRLWRNRRARRDLRLLQAMDDHALSDIGLTRAELGRLLSLSNSVDLVWEADRARMMRGR